MNSGKSCLIKGKDIVEDMELKIINSGNSGFQQKIEWKLDAPAENITAAKEEYATFIRKDNALKAAESDRVRINKLVNAIENERRKLKTVIIPYNRPEKEEKEPLMMVQKAVIMIDGQTKNYG